MAIYVTMASSAPPTFNSLLPEKPGSLENLDFLVTSFKLSSSTISILPHWVCEVLPKPKATAGRRPPSYEGESTRSIVGTQNKPVENCSAPLFGKQLAAHGFVPMRRKISIRGWRNESPLYRLNIYWSKRHANDSPSIDYEILRNQDLFKHLQGFAWNVVGSEILQCNGARTIVIDFKGRKIIPPSMHHHMFEVKSNHIVLL